MELTEEIIQNELNLQDGYDRLSFDSRISKDRRSSWRRVFYFHELARKLLVHYHGENAHANRFAFESEPKPGVNKNGPRVLLRGIQRCQRDETKSFSPWVSPDSVSRPYVHMNLIGQIRAMQNPKK